GGTAAERLAAVETLSDTNDPALKALLTTAAANDPDAAVREAAGAAVKAIDTRMAVLEVGQNLIFGLSAGSILLLAAIGLAITFGVMGVINMAHGEMLMLGAYTTFVVQEVFRATLPPSVFGLYLVVAIPAAFVVAGAVGVAMERGIIRFLYGRPLETLLATWGISLILQQAVRSLFGATNREVANPDWMSGSLELLGLSLTANRIVIILFAFAVLAGLAAFLRWSPMGLNMRAVTQNRRMASAMGIPTGRVDALTFGLGSGIAGVAGVAISQVANVSPNLGQGYIVDSFMVVVFGGVGSLWGALAGAFSLGVVNKFLEPMAGAMLGKILVLVFIILFIQKRPRGLFALRGRAFEN
ncbi:MAG: urea ABC transporter permease subunit UrtB, partial [Caenispirillum bisanense]|nr:urea ABC transporter permease subunit UrtB [Caenispirillum bisanense]